MYMCIYVCAYNYTCAYYLYIFTNVYILICIYAYMTYKKTAIHRIKNSRFSFNNDKTKYNF